MSFLKEFNDIFKEANSWNELKENMIKFAENDYSFVGKVLFEKFAKYYFLFNPSSRSDYKEIWLYSEIPYEIKARLNLPYKDHGIDLLLQDHKDRFYAVQCKFKLNENTKLCWTKDKIGNFFGSTNKVDGYIFFTNAYDIDEVSHQKGASTTPCQIPILG
jgi:predicted helicase